MARISLSALTHSFGKGEVARNPENFKSRYNHLNHSFHNYLRISRILKALGEFGFERFKIHWINLFIEEVFVHGNLRNVLSSLKGFWIPTLRHREDRVAAKNKIHAYQKEDDTDDEGDDMGENEDMKDLPSPPPLPNHISPPIAAGSEDADEEGRSANSGLWTSSSSHSQPTSDAISQSEDESVDPPKATPSFIKDEVQSESSVQSPPHASTDSLSASADGSPASSNDSSGNAPSHPRSDSRTSASSSSAPKPSRHQATDSNTSTDTEPHRSIRKSNSKRADPSTTDKKLKDVFVQSNNTLGHLSPDLKETAAQLALLQIDDTLAGSSAGEEDEDLSATEDFSDDRDAPSKAR